MALAVAALLLVLPTQKSQAQTFKVVHTFQNNLGPTIDGASPAYVNPVLDSKENLYGTTQKGGTGASGTVFKLSPTNKLTLLYSFSGGADGKYPNAGVILDGKGDLYGSTELGGLYGEGIIFELSPKPKSGCPAGSNPGDGWCETVLYSFAGNSEPGENGGYPYDAPIQDAEGNLYGTTYYGGEDTSANCAEGCGTVFKLEPNGAETVLYRFSEEKGQQPSGGLVRDAEGNLYGTTYSGGSPDLFGLVFRISSKKKYTDLLTFTDGTLNDGALPYAGMIIDTDGNLYGTTTGGGTLSGGTVFRLDKANNYKETVLHDFGGNDGVMPTAGVFMDASGNLYGTTEMGGADSWGCRV